ncbi:Outer membrane receptor proteins, mostly Fe transport [Chryseobacterium sp. RU37D]|uniref:TonB-dependent receptor n=1 Tax=Chryseobacterium sp. RU37D TaxID=1907397 RepID=UPI000956A03F|nr:TonB-dependent receptor [Chryseobacterium sp. RU37D]SIQ06892.1 Outer membrane receptor proteins, mostly Fe transport [Chryseobacterium sp. RU37D]
MMKTTMLAIFLSAFSYAQQSYSINGMVKDESSGEPITGAIITIKENPNISIETNGYGFYTLSLPENDYTLVITHPKHKALTKTIHLAETLKIDWALEKENEIEMVEIKGKKSPVVTKSKLGGDVLDVMATSKLPVLFGERDILKTLQFLPGVVSNEGSSGLSIRGGNTDQNLVLFDGAPVFNNSHFLGFFSTFNSDALRDVTLYKSNIPSQFGGRLSSVLDIKGKEGNNQKFGVNGGIGLISSRLSVEGPIQKGKSSFIISGRRTYADLLYRLISKEESAKSAKLYFYDLNAKLNFQINANNSIHLSGYLGKDIFKYDEFHNNWANAASSLRWNSIISSKLFSTTSLIYSNYNYNIGVENIVSETVDIKPNINNLVFKQDFSHSINQKHSLNYGIQASYYNFSLPKISGSQTDLFVDEKRSMWENALYINDDFKPMEGLSLNYGIRAAMYSAGKDQLAYGDAGEKTSHIIFEPRIMMNYELNKSNLITASYNRSSQGITALSANDGSFTNDIWINLKKPMVSDHFGLGYTKKFEGGYEIGTDVFYKKMSNIADYKEGVKISQVDDLQNNLLFNGIGRAYGIELLAKKTSGKLTGWISYTLSKSERKINGINQGNWYNATQDKTHNLSIVANYSVSPKWTFSGAFVFATGNAVTFPVAKYTIDGNTALQYGARNGNRMPSYNRLDINATYEPQNNKRFKSSWSFGLYNIYGKLNPYSIEFSSDGFFPTDVKISKFVLFAIVPNITYNFKF